MSGSISQCFSKLGSINPRGYRNRLKNPFVTTPDAPISTRANAMLPLDVNPAESSKALVFIDGFLSEHKERCKSL
ncbi:hypothetical protein WA1_38155 [Scytonema hofmannii PCC 7110]|uniref:Uncharacterized protein n=1 Tax=Scytonema hofmannii PCC 7110 TaxID=128403 RepID=A0A139X0D9_9CYAN|nr:hypothetical protein [Scytonema hofmannii]KYC38171.1 hypothetical protein WA1_38155 [Scytonema hofmannii PCC 7110]